MSGSGNDFIDNFRGSNVTIDADNGNDTIKNSFSENVYVKGSDGNDYIYNWDGSKISIDGGDGNDSIHKKGNNVTINGGAGNDFIFNGYEYGSMNNVTINAGTGDDYISLGSSSSLNVIRYANGDGNDILYGSDSADTIKISGAKYSTVKSGNDLKIIVGSGSILLKDVVANGVKLNIQGTLSDDTVSTVETAKNITNTKSNTILSGTKYADTISNLADNVTIDGGADNDYIHNSGNNATIIGGDGQDTIVATSSALTLTDFSSEDVIALTDSIKSIAFDENSKALKLDDKIVISLTNINVIKSNWTTSDNSVTYTPAQLPEFTLAKNGKSITVAEGKATTPVTVSGLKNGLKVKDDSISGIILNNSNFPHRKY